MATGVGTIFSHDDNAALELLRAHLAKVISLAAQGADVIVLPEKIALVSNEASSQIDLVFAATSTRANAGLVVGLDCGSETRRFNEARVYLPREGLLARYHKHYLVPGFEDTNQP